MRRRKRAAVVVIVGPGSAVLLDQVGHAVIFEGGGDDLRRGQRILQPPRDRAKFGRAISILRRSVCAIGHGIRVPYCRRRQQDNWTTLAIRVGCRLLREKPSHSRKDGKNNNRNKPLKLEFARGT